MYNRQITTEYLLANGIQKGLRKESPYQADSPHSYDVEEGELSSGSGRSSPGTIRDNASECGTQTVPNRTKH